MLNSRVALSPRPTPRENVETPVPLRGHSRRRLSCYMCEGQYLVTRVSYNHQDVGLEAFVGCKL
jgi:hypothetical protein